MIMKINHSMNHRLSINRPTKGGKEKSPSMSLSYHTCLKTLSMRKRDGQPITDVSTNS
jgi:hypothetical protein